MPNYNYETHKMPDPLLPFIYHYRFEVRSREKVPNWHENIEFLQAVEGSGYVHCGTERFCFSAGDLFVINADTLHGIGSNTRLVYRCLIVDNSFFASNGIPVETLRFQNVIRDDAVFSLFDAVTAAYAARREDFRSVLDIRAAVLLFLQSLCRSYITLAAPVPSDGHIKKAIAYIRTHLSEPITLDILAAHVGIGKYHLSRRFKAFTGKTVVQVVNLMRCTEARRLMEDGMAVGAAAASCGFENLSYFTRTYKSLMGTLPSKIKKPAE